MKMFFTRFYCCVKYLFNIEYSTNEFYSSYYSIIEIVFDSIIMMYFIIILYISVNFIYNKFKDKYRYIKHTYYMKNFLFIVILFSIIITFFSVIILIIYSINISFSIIEGFEVTIKKNLGTTQYIKWYGSSKSLSGHHFVILFFFLYSRIYSIVLYFFFTRPVKKKFSVYLNIEIVNSRNIILQHLLFYFFYCKENC